MNFKSNVLGIDSPEIYSCTSSDLLNTWMFPGELKFHTFNLKVNFSPDKEVNGSAREGIRYSNLLPESSVLVTNRNVVRALIAANAYH